jgi:crossover junction endodeoxyribonuclease RuvC
LTIFPQRILGIDPGTATVGYGAVIHSENNELVYLGAGVIQTPKEMIAGKRLNMIRCDIIQLIQKFNPDILAVETIFFFKNAKTAMAVAQARGVILEAAASCSVPVAEYTPMQVKLQITGTGKADKRLVQEMVATLFGLSAIIKSDDASDALALAVCHTRLKYLLSPALEPAS